MLTCSVVVVFFTRHTTDSGDPSAGQLRGTYPTVPAQGWTVDADDVVTGGKFVRPDPTSYQYLQPGFIDLGDTLISTVILPRTDMTPVLVAIDSRTGALRWQTPIDSYPSRPSCATQTIGGLLPCIGGESVQFFRMSDGRLDHTLAAGDVSRVEVIDGDIVTAGYREMSRGTTEDLTARWHKTYTIDPLCPGSGDSQQFGVSRRFVYFGSDAGAVVADATDGRRVIDSELQGVAIYPGFGLIGRRCTRSTMESVVVDETGRQLRTHDGRSWPAAPWLVRPDEDDTYIVGRTAYDFATGAGQWTASGREINHIVGDIAISNSLDAITGYDRRTGATLWTSAASGIIVASDGERILLADQNILTAVDLRTGRSAWVLHNPASSHVEPAGQGFAVATVDRISHYPPTGGLAEAPGTAGTQQKSGLDAAAGSRQVTKCGSVPTIRPVEYRTDSGGLIVKAEIKATCPGGDIVSSDRMRITVTASGQTVASGYFDFADTPMYLPRTDTASGGVTITREFKYPVGSFWRLPNSLGPSSGTSSATSTVTAASDQLVECEEQSQGHGPGSAEIPATSTVVSPLAATAAAPPSRIDTEAASLDALRAQADADRPFVAARLADRWVAQLSAKRPGLVAPDVDGRMVQWNATEILNQHLRLRLMYPDVRLVWSDEWRTFDLDGWWVTIAGVTFADPDAANGWCDGHGIAVDECFAKLVSDTRGPSGTTAYRR
ncbi:PQQ-binding-like beta-propeller repeat protein [Nocardia ninae]|nr:PQQ-binding-like beta-propeller repeat protein [Nocardia ninae]